MTRAFTDIDDLKQAWQQLERRLERQHALAFEQFKDGRMRQMQRGLRPLYWGQIVQLAVGAACMVASVRAAYLHWPVPHVLAAAAVMLVYGLVAIEFAARTLRQLSRLDPTAPVVAIQAQLAAMRRWYVLSELIVGLPWWFLWLPAFMVAAGLAGVDVFARAPRLLTYAAVIGVAGLALTFAFHWLARRPGWPRLARYADESMVAASLRRAQAAVDEVQRFAADDVTSSAAESAATAGTASSGDRG
jgi:hypothetical protein